MIEDDDVSDVSLLKLVYTDVMKTSPEFHTRKFDSTLNHLRVDFSQVHIKVHQDAIIDLIQKLTKLTSDLSSEAKNLMSADEPAIAAAADEQVKAKPPVIQRPPSRTEQQQPLVRRRSRRWSLKLA